jgi:diguanylate cyclase (GGDEF)-like protein
LHELSITDGLTQLKNRSYFDKVMEAETNKATRGNYPVALIIIDIDHFKKVNDTYGHLAGDECLRHVANILRAHVKRISDVIARYGGEEFAVVLPDTECDEALLLAEEIRKAVATSPVSFARQVISLTLSCGIASTIPQSRRSVEELISHADEALYRAKENGRNRCLINHQESLA